MIHGAASCLFGYGRRGRAGGGSPVFSPWTFGLTGLGISRLLHTPVLPLVMVPPPEQRTLKAAREDGPPWMEGLVNAPHIGNRCPKEIRASASNAHDGAGRAGWGGLARQDLPDIWHCPQGHQLMLVSGPRTGLSASSCANLRSRYCKTQGQVVFCCKKPNKNSKFSRKRPNLRLWVLLPNHLCTHKGNSCSFQAQTGVPWGQLAPRQLLYRLWTYHVPVTCLPSRVPSRLLCWLVVGMCLMAGCPLTSQRRRHISPGSLQHTALQGCMGIGDRLLSLEKSPQKSMFVIPQGPAMPQEANAAAGDVVNQGEEALVVTTLRHGGYF